jgi:hypothetical protein
MKHAKLFMAMCVAIFAVLLLPAVSSAQVSVSAGIHTQDFSLLANFGDWRPHPRFGQVWIPAVTPGWRPFMYGEWINADEGWTWDSYEPYGWLTDHYGNWYYDPQMGWVWVPGYTYSAAPVDFITYDNYIGWAPLPPPGFPAPDFFAPGASIVFNVVKINDFDRHDLPHVVMTQPPPARNRGEIRRGAPAPEAIQRVTGRPIVKEHFNREETKLGDRTFHKIVPNDGVIKRSADMRAEAMKHIKARPQQEQARKKPDQH